MGEWCREVILEAVTEAEAGTPTVETLLAEVMALRTILLNVLFQVANGETVTADAMRQLIERADRERFRRAAERVEEQAARKKPQPEKPGGDGR